MAATKQLAAFEEAAHGLAFMEAGVPLCYLRANRDGSGACEPMPDHLITHEQNLFISDVGAAGQELLGNFDAAPSDGDIEVAMAAMPYIGSDGHRAELLRSASAWVWAHEAEITALANAVLATPVGFLGTEAIGELCRAKGSPLSRFAKLYPASAPKPAPKPAKSLADEAADWFDEIGYTAPTAAKPSRAVCMTPGGMHRQTATAGCGLFGR